MIGISKLVGNVATPIVMVLEIIFVFRTVQQKIDAGVTIILHIEHVDSDVRGIQIIRGEIPHVKGAVIVVLYELLDNNVIIIVYEILIATSISDHSVD